MNIKSILIHNVTLSYTHALSNSHLLINGNAYNFDWALRISSPCTLINTFSSDSQTHVHISPNAR